MADSLHLSIWFSTFDTDEILNHAVAVMRQFPFSSEIPGISGLAIHPLAWSEATVLEERFREGVSPEEAANMAADWLHEDYAYVFEAHWDVWTPATPEGKWSRRPSVVQFIVRGEGFEEGEREREGQLEVDFGPDSPFLHEELALSDELRSGVRLNIEMLVNFSNRLETHAGARARLLWSESEENLAQKLVSRLNQSQ